MNNDSSYLLNTENTAPTTKQNLVIQAQQITVIPSPTKKYWFSTLFTLKHEVKEIKFKHYPDSQRIVQNILQVIAYNHPTVLTCNP